MQKLTKFERAILLALVSDDKSASPLRALRLEALRVECREMSPIGFLTNLEPTASASIYADTVSLQWGDRFTSTINSTTLVGMVVFVNHGRISAVEAFTFCGEAWPQKVLEFTAPSSDQRLSGPG